jgi:FkbM family methyltransferase
MNSADYLKSVLRVLLWPAPKVIFDVGACDGVDTLRYQKLFPMARFFVFEPLPRNVEKLRNIFGRSNQSPPDTFIAGIALSDLDGEATFHVSAGDPDRIETDDEKKSEIGNKASSLLQPRHELPEMLRWMEFPEQIAVPTARLESFCREHALRRIDFIHMDVQGAEKKVLSGAGQMLGKIGVIWMEVAFEPSYECQPLEPEMTDWMRRQGFRKLHAVSYGPEGDALYFNMRHFSSWPRLLLLKLLQRWGVVRYHRDA